MTDNDYLDQLALRQDGTWRAHTFTAASLKTMTFNPVRWVVPGVIPEGVTILAGRPKIGK